MVWREVDSNCAECGASVGKMEIVDGRIAVREYGENWGTWRKVPGKAEMQVVCRECQRRLDRREGGAGEGADKP